MEKAGKARILIVDADEAIRFTFQRFLANEGYGPVSTAATAADVLAQVDRDKEFDLIICDILLEDIKGPELLRKLRDAGIDCPVVMTTGYPDLESATELVRLGAFDYIVKPINKQTLLHFTALALRHRALQKEKNRLQAENDKYRRHLEAVFRSVRDAIISVDNEMNIIRLNDMARQWIGEFSGGDVIEPRKLDDVPGRFGQACVADAAEVIRRHTHISEHTLECPVPGRGVRLIGLSVTPITEESGSFAGVVIFARDITVSGVPHKKSYQGAFHGFVDNSPAMVEVYNLIENVGKVDTTVLITGESGTGKELTAEALHAESPRRDGALVKVDCASIPEELLESELFGHLKGAFTGADRDRTGRILQADGGTLFLDEIGDISPRLQLRLLRFLQERTFYPVGGDKPVKVDVRVITATNADLQDKVGKGLFREDLYYRLRVIEINLPPLRARREGIPQLVNHFLEKFSARLNREISGISDQALQMLVNYSWPGNVRELRHIIERACVLCTDPVLTLECFPAELSQPRPAAGQPALPARDVADTLPRAADFPSSRQFSSLPGPPHSQDESDADRINEIIDALRQARGNKAKAARILGIDRSTLYRRMQRFNIS